MDSIKPIKWIKQIKLCTSCRPKAKPKWRHPNIGLFFGSFNPIHKGHIAIANYFVCNNYVDEVWFVISPQSPFKQHFIDDETSGTAHSSEYFLSTEKRLQLLNAAIEDFPKLMICHIELSLPTPSYTIDTLKELSKIYHDENFILIMGGDQLKDFKLWKDWQTILDDYSVYVYPRSNEDSQYLLPKMKMLDDAPLLDISSTQIRAGILI